MIEYKHDQENEGQMVHLAAPAVTEGGGIWNPQKANKTRPRIDRGRLKALPENETNDSGELMDTIEGLFLPAQQPPPAQQKQELAPTDGNRQIPLTRTTKTEKIQEFVMSKTSKSGDPIRGLPGQPHYNVIDEILKKPVNITAGQLFNILNTAVKQMAFSLKRCMQRYQVRKTRKLPTPEDDVIDDAFIPIKAVTTPPTITSRAHDDGESQPLTWFFEMAIYMLVWPTMILLH